MAGVSPAVNTPRPLVGVQGRIESCKFIVLIVDP